MSPLTRLSPLKTLMQSGRGRSLPLPPGLSRLYGDLRMPLPRSDAHVFSNFVTTVDGVVSLQVKGHSAGGDISGFSAQDRMVMGLLRAVADVVIVGSGTLAADPHHVWTADAICPELAPDYRRLRENMRKPGPALNVVVSTSGAVDLRLPVFAAGRVPALILTSPSGARRLATQRRPVGVRVRAIGARNGHIAPRAILGEVARLRPGRRILLEGGPQLLGSFYRDGLIDEQFLTLAPQIAGRAAGDGRLSLVMGQLFAPRNPRWGSLSDARRGHSHLFLRYSFPARPPI